MTAQTLEMRYAPSKNEYETGVKDHRVSGGIFNPQFVDKKRQVVAGGCGTYITATKSHFVLRIKIGDKEHEVWTEWVFKELLNINRLTPKVRDRITATMPREVEVSEQEGPLGTQYYMLDRNSAADWAKQVA